MKGYKDKAFLGAGYRRGWEPGPAVLDLKVVPALLRAGYRPPEAMMRRERQIVLMGMYKEMDNGDIPPSGQGQACQDTQVDNIEPAGREGHGHTDGKSVSKKQRANVGYSAFERPSGCSPTWPFKSRSQIIAERQERAIREAIAKPKLPREPGPPRGKRKASGFQ